MCQDVSVCVWCVCVRIRAKVRVKRFGAPLGTAVRTLQKLGELGFGLGSVLGLADQHI